MDRILLIQNQTLRVLRLPGDVGVYSFYDVDSVADALAWLRPFSRDPIALIRLRSLLAEDAMTMEAPRLPDDKVIEQVAWRISRGRILLAEEYRRKEPPEPAEEEAGPPPSGTTSGPAPKKLTWIEFQVLDDVSGAPFCNVRMTVKLPTGNEEYHTTDAKGVIRIDPLEPGSCDLSCDLKNAKRSDTLAFVAMGAAPPTKPGSPPPKRDASTARIALVPEHKLTPADSMDALAKPAKMTGSDLAKFNWDSDAPATVDQAKKDGSTIFIPGGWKQTGLATTDRHIIRVKLLPPLYHVWIIELEDLHFHFDSAVMLPDYDTESPNPEMKPEPRITALCILAECLREAQRHPERKFIITGHTDTKGPAGYNVTLSQQRGDNALFALMGERDHWVAVTMAKHKVEDYQLILKWVARDWGWECDPGSVDNKDGPETRAATTAFQKRYNKEFGKTIGEDGSVGKETWGAFFDIYMQELSEILELDGPDKLAPLRSKIQFVDANKKAVGCGESFPKDKRGVDEWRSMENRRVELLFFDPNQLPPTACHPTRGVCQAPLCKINDPNVYPPTVIPVPPVLPRFARLIVHLQLVYKDPDEAIAAPHVVPKDFPILVEYADGSTQQEKVGDNGLLTFLGDKRKQSFRLRYKFDKATYLASVPPGSTEKPPEQFAPESATPELVKKGLRVFLIPQDWSTEDSDWLPTGEPQVGGTSIYQNGRFTQLQTISAIGSAGAPAVLTLDPHWLHAKFLYFDRKLKQKLSSLPLTVEGSPDASVANPPVETRSNWLTDPENCQCVPWILRKKAGAATNTPSQKVLLQFRTAPETFIDSTSGTRKLVTRNAAASTDVGLTVGPSVGTDFTVPNAARIACYDLPALWKSKGYLGQWSAGTGAAVPDADRKFFGSLPERQSTNAKPLLFSLDDIVLCMGDASAKLTPIAWAPATDRAAIFSNTFLNGANPQDIGPYKPDTAPLTANNKSYFSQQVDKLQERNYIADYPDWTRLVIAKGNLFEVFDRRMPDSANGPVGARAGVCWADSASLTAPGADLPPAAANGSRGARPMPVRTSTFSVIQPFFEQRHDRWWTVTSPGDRGTGRFDLLLLRCCDVDATDESIELGACFNYFRFAFNFAPAANPPAGSPANTPVNPAIGPDNPPAFNKTNSMLTGWTVAQQDQWTEIALKNIPGRWSGPDGAMNATVAIVRPQDQAAHKLALRVIWFAQNLPRTIAHFELGIFQTTPGAPFGPEPAGYFPIRAYMGSGRGYGTLDRSDHQAKVSGWFTAAHETGHGGSLGDEYMEPTTNAGATPQPPTPWILGFDSNMPGGPYDDDKDAMMNHNKQVRPRFFWHVAEWCSFLYGFDFQVDQANRHYKLQRVTPARNATKPYMFTHVNWPIALRRNAAHGTRGNCDLFYYPLGEEEYSATVLPGLAAAKMATPGAVLPFDGIIMILVKMQWNFHFNNISLQHQWLQAIDDRIARDFAFRWMASDATGSPHHSRVLLHFSARYYSPQYSFQAPNDTAQQFTVNTQNTGATAWGTRGNLRTLTFTMLAPAANSFPTLFGNMLGIADGSHMTAASFEPIVREVLPNATVAAIS